MRGGLKLLTDFCIIDGDTFAVSVIPGAVVRVQKGGGEVVEVVASDGEAVFEGLSVGTYYVVCRAPGASSFQRVGQLVVDTIVDEQREMLVREIEDLNQRVAAAEAIQFQITDPGGISVQRVQLSQLRLARSRAEIRLRAYDRRQRGEPPLVFL